MYYAGTVRKMHVSVDDNRCAQYQLPIGDNTVEMNGLIGNPISLTYSGNIQCIHCQRKTKKSFGQGYCYPCLISLAQCDTCIIKPELCHYHQGTCREPSWGEEHCLSDHFIYLANTGNVKVGITRHVTDGVSSRWIDQGASQATVMLRVPDRLTSGKIEKLCTQYIGDKTNWRTMLKGVIPERDLVTLKHELLDKLSSELQLIAAEKGLTAFAPVPDTQLQINYPVRQYPVKIKSINLDKTASFSGILQGIKGQYWLLDQDRVINIRKYAGYFLELNY